MMNIVSNADNVHHHNNTKILLGGFSRYIRIANPSAVEVLCSLIREWKLFDAQMIPGAECFASKVPPAATLLPSLGEPQVSCTWLWLTGFNHELRWQWRCCWWGLWLMKITCIVIFLQSDMTRIQWRWRWRWLMKMTCRVFSTLPIAGSSLREAGETFHPRRLPHLP